MQYTSVADVFSTIATVRFGTRPSSVGHFAIGETVQRTRKSITVSVAVRTCGHGVPASRRRDEWVSLTQKARRAKRAANDQAGKVKPKRTMSASAHGKIAAAQRARWAKVRARQGSCSFSEPSAVRPRLQKLRTGIHQVVERIFKPPSGQTCRQSIPTEVACLHL